MDLAAMARQYAANHYEKGWTNRALVNDWRSVIMASKYDALADYLGQQSGPRHTMRFAEIEPLIGTPLPASAHIWPAWWANDLTHTHAKNGWLAAGWQVHKVNQDQQIVTFCRVVASLGY